jgi:hypothetical protein
MTSSPGFTPAAMPARVRPVVADVTASAHRTPQYAANASSNSLTFMPHDGAPFRMTSVTASVSSGPYSVP